MSLFNRHRSDGDRYKVTVVTPNDKHSVLRSPRKATVLVKKTVRIINNMFMALMLALLGLLGSIGAAGPAHANFIEDGFKSAFCSDGLANYDLEQKRGFMRATTGDENSPTVTPYEKYGMAGLQYTIWVGPERQEGLDGKGEFGGNDIVNFVGGEGTTDIDKVGDGVANAKKNEATQAFPGFYNSQQTCSPITDAILTSVANGVSMLTGTIVLVANMMYQTAFEASSNIINVMSEPVTTISRTLLNSLYMEFLTPVVMLAALWMAWTGLVKKASIQAAQGALWMIGSAAASIAIISNPMTIPNTANTVISSVSQGIMTAVSSQGMGDDEDALCYVEDEGDKTRANVRQFQCTMWENFLYTPWVLGQFDENPKNAPADSKLKMAWNDAQGGSIHGQPAITAVKPVTFGKDGRSPAPEAAQNWALFHLDNKVKLSGQSNAETLDQKRSLVNVAIAQLHTDDYNGAYKGEGSMNRVGMATLALIGSLGAAVFVGVVSMSIVVMDISLILLVLVAPFVLLLGVHPGFGRRVALTWVEAILGIALKRMVLSIFLAVVVLAYSAAFSMGGTNWLLSLFFLFGMTFALFKLKNWLTNLVADKLNLGGDGASIVKGEEKAASKAKAAAGGAIAGTAMAMAGRFLPMNAGAGMRPKTTMKVASAKQATAAVKHRVAPNAGSKVAGSGSAPVKKAPVQQTSSAVPAPSAVPASSAAPSAVPAPTTAPVSTTVPTPVVGAEPVVTLPNADTNADSFALPTPVMPDDKAIKRDLKEAGYKPRVGIRTVAKASMRGAIVGATTGNTKAAVMAGVGTVSQERVKLQARNEAAVEQVSGAINAKRIEAEKAQARAQVEADRKTREQEAEARKKAQEAKKQTREQEAAAKKKAQEAGQKAQKQAQTVSKAKEQVAKKHGPISAPVRKTIPRPAPRPTPPAPRPTPQVPRPAPKAPQLPRPKN